MMKQLISTNNKFSHNIVYILVIIAAVLFLHSGCSQKKPDNKKDGTETKPTVSFSPPKQGTQSRVAPDRFGEDKTVRVRKRKYLPRKIWDVAGSPNLEMERYYFKKAVEKDPKNVEAWCFLGFNYREAYMYNDAIKCFKKVLKLEPGNKFALENLSFIYLEKKDYKEALNIIEKGLKHHPQNPQLIYLLARVKLEGEKDPEGAAIILEKALADGIEDPRVNRGLAMAYFKMQKPVKGIQILEESVKKFPMYPDTYLILAEKYIETKGDDQGAIKLLNKLIELVPSYSDAYLQLGDIYIDVGDFKSAEIVYQEALRQRPENMREIHLQLGRAYMGLDDLDNAGKHFEKAMVKDGKKVGDSIATGAIVGLIKVNIEKKDYKSAESLIKIAVKKAPDDPEVNFCRSDLEYARGNYKKAKEILGNIEIDNKDLESYERSRAITRGKKNEVNPREDNKGDNEDKDSSEVEMELKYRLSRTYSKSGDKKKSKKLMEDAIELAPAHKKKVMKERFEKEH
ncbi:MAG: tetratricopeptide repeat protein [Candidatus Eremiobacteraeota bacterium]|nr:tetratricopeptide repeat protein [Candidatus Eremiobacteraeota bacterium]